MSTTVLLTFALVAFIAVITPGLDTMVVLRNVTLSGRRAGLTAVLGITAGCVVWGTASIAGLTALLTASRIAYEIVHYGGAAYLLWLGGSALWRSYRRRHDGAPAGETPLPVRTVAAWSAFRRGLTTNLLNPKVGVFYLSLLPQFLPSAGPAAAWGTLLVAIHISIELLWLSLITWVAGFAGRILTKERVRRWMDRITATVLVGLGLKLVFENP
jgi:threonine/homoserine/homoserine lactone efflux protein